MNSYEFTLDLIKNETILDLEEFTEKAIKATFAMELTQEKFVGALNDFNSLEGLDNQFCVNFTGAWLKYALNGILVKDKMKSGKLIRDVLGDDFKEKERGGGTPPPQLSDEMYRKVNWNSQITAIEEDYSDQPLYILKKCKKHQPSNNSWQSINMILLRPDDFLNIITSSRCVSEYRTYFIKLAKIRRAYQETYVPWILKRQKNNISRLEQKVDELLNNSRHLITTVEDNKVEISKLHTKIDTLFEFLLSFARIVIPVMVGSSVIKQQFDTLTKNKDTGYALKHLKVMFMVGFFKSFSTPVQHTKMIGDQEIIFTGRGQLKIYACCTNFADIGPRIRKLYQRYTDDSENIMYMLKPKVISLISCEINLERIILENSNLFPKKSMIAWESRHKCYGVTIPTAHYKKAQTIFNFICKNATKERFQGYQMRIDEYNNTDNIKVDPKITTYIDKVDSEFFLETAPFCQSYIDCYTIQDIDKDGDMIEYKYATPNRRCAKRLDLADANLSNISYNLRKIHVTIEEHHSKDHVKHMAETGIISKEDIPALKALAKFDNIDLSEIDIPEDLEDYE